MRYNNLVDQAMLQGSKKAKHKHKLVTAKPLSETQEAKINAALSAAMEKAQGTNGK